MRKYYHTLPIHYIHKQNRYCEGTSQVEVYSSIISPSGLWWQKFSDIRRVPDGNGKTVAVRFPTSRHCLRKNASNPTLHWLHHYTNSIIVCTFGINTSGRWDTLFQLSNAIICPQASLCDVQTIGNALRGWKSGEIWEGVVGFWPLTNSILLVGLQTTVQSFIKIDWKLRPYIRKWTDRDNRRRRWFYNLSHAAMLSINQSINQSIQSINQSIKSNQDLYSAICSRRFRGAWRMDYYVWLARWYRWVFKCFFERQ